MFYVRAILADVFTELSGDFCISFQQVLTGHTCFAGCTTGRNDVRCSGQRFFDIRSISKVDTFEAAVVQFFCHPFQSGSKRIIQTNIRSEFHHHGSLSHIGANHSGCSYNCKFLVGQKFHKAIYLKVNNLLFLFVATKLTLY